MNKTMRAKRTRYKLRNVSSDRTRLSIFRSINHIYVQAIDDNKKVTLASASTNCKNFPLKNSKKMQQAEWVGKEIAKKLSNIRIKDVYLDRGAKAYGGIIKTLAEAARMGGLNF